MNTVQFSHDRVRIDGTSTENDCLEAVIHEVAANLIERQITIRDEGVYPSEPQYCWVFEQTPIICICLDGSETEVIIRVEDSIWVESDSYRGYTVPEVSFRYEATLVKFEWVDGKAYAFYRLTAEKEY